MAAITIGVVQGNEAAQAEALPLSAGDLMQQMHVVLAGRIGKRPVWTERDVTFPYPFLMRVAQSQVDSALMVPTFVPGVEMVTDDDAIVFAKVKKWTIQESEWITGATLKVCSWIPDAPKRVMFNAVLHATFIGYGAPSEDEAQA